MSWRDRLQKGSFRGVAYLTQAHDASGGRRLELNEYPLRDEPYAEDLGRKAREFSVELYTLGAAYMEARDKLIEAFEKKGPGTLVHPYLGQRQVAVREYRLRESSRDGGMASFTVTFVEAGRAAQPAAKADTAGGVTASVDSAIESFKVDYADVFDTVNSAGFVATEAVAAVKETLAKISRTVGDLTGPIAAVIRAPYDMAAVITGGIGKIKSAAPAPLDAMKLYSSNFKAGSELKPVPTTTPSRRQQAKNQYAIQQVVRRTAVTEACRESAKASFASADEALATRKLLTEATDDLMAATDPVSGAPISDAVYESLRKLRVAVVLDLTERGAKLPRLTRHTPKAMLPAGVVAYKIYGDAARADEIVARNKIRHPGFVPGGRQLEVLSDA